MFLVHRVNIRSQSENISIWSLGCAQTGGCTRTLAGRLAVHQKHTSYQATGQRPLAWQFNKLYNMIFLVYIRAYETVKASYGL